MLHAVARGAKAPAGRVNAPMRGVKPTAPEHGSDDTRARHASTIPGKEALLRGSAAVRSPIALRPSHSGILQRKCACGGGCPRCQTTGETAGVDHHRETAGPSSRVIGRADDPAEREADAIATAILDGRAHNRPSRLTGCAIRAKGKYGGTCTSSGGASDEREEEATPVQTKLDSASAGRVGNLSPRLDARHGGGERLPSEIERSFAPRLGVPLGGVRIHRDAEAGNLANSIGALAFTAGYDVYFAPGRYAPHERAGAHLLAHELVHVAQQGSDDRDAPIRCYTLAGFDPTQEAQMRAAVASAKKKMLNCPVSKAFTQADRGNILRGLDEADYVYVADLEPCGRSNKLTDTIKLGPSAFDYAACCDLDSTLAHECAHSFAWGFEKFARNVECKCFGCSCD